MQRPGLPSAVGLPSAAQTEPPWFEKGPSRLSSVATRWFARGTTAFALRYLRDDPRYDASLDAAAVIALGNVNFTAAP